MIKKVLDCLFRSLAIIGLVIALPLNVFAASKTEDKTIKELRVELADLKKQKNENDNKKQMTEAEIKNSYNKITAAENKKNENKAKVDQAEKDIEDSENEIVRVTEEINVVLRYNQIELGENATLSYVMGADTPAELVVRMAVAEKITENNQNTLESLENLIKQNEQLKVDLANNNKQLDSSIANYQNIADENLAALEQISEVNEDINSQIKNQQELINYYKKVCKTEDQKVSTCVEIGYAAGWKKPMTSGRISSLVGTRWGKFHNAADLAAPVGTPVYAAAAGRVSAISYRQSCGGNIVYIHHNVLGKYYTTQYAHLYTINSNIKVGTVVTANTQLGTVGGTKSSTPWDGCSTGAHLHYGVATDRYLVDYKNWSTYLARAIDPPGFPRQIGWRWSKR